ncbi:hypothetical protein DSO57_1000694 [Entomophthora muscae]|uniref:Uncharacterized protein n=1 Tax=Entomophthora muscae TaxID=34485 RepID=A0ACC2SLV6_9FUNG|nr:hypothetical protein DSO57_1000694 [Entomophthora muscae]
MEEIIFLSYPYKSAANPTVLGNSAQVDSNNVNSGHVCQGPEFPGQSASLTRDKETHSMGNTLPTAFQRENSPFES